MIYDKMSEIRKQNLREPKNRIRLNQPTGLFQLNRKQVQRAPPDPQGLTFWICTANSLVGAKIKAWVSRTW